MIGTALAISKTVFRMGLVFTKLVLLIRLTILIVRNATSMKHKQWNSHLSKNLWTLKAN